jgi:exonuclease III
MELDNESVSMNSSFRSIDFNFSNLKGLKIANLNVNSLLKHIDDLRLMLSDNPFDILAINESKLDSSIPDYEIHIHNYSIVCLDRNRCGGGVALYFKNTLPYLERKHLVFGNLEMICVEITNQHSRPFLVTTWYRPLNSAQDIFNNFKMFLFKSDLAKKETIIVGDLDCDVNKLTPDTQTRKLQTLCSLYQLSQVINEPTRVRETTTTLIDLILTNKPEIISSAGVLHLGISDHSLVYAVRKYEFPKSRPIIKEVCDFKHFSDSHFRADQVSSSRWRSDASSEFSRFHCSSKIFATYISV